jgi:hypothetical protein
MKYIYINEDGQVGVSDDAPTPTDLLQIGDGQLQVLEVSIETDESESLDYASVLIEDVNDDGKTRTPDVAVRGSDPSDGLPFHYIE